MATPTIKIDQSPLVAGTPGVSRDDLATGAVVTLTDPANGAGAYSWVLVVPSGSSATLSGGSTATATFTPDIRGTYLVYLDFDADLSYTLNADGNKVSGQGGAGVKQRNGVRALGVGETFQFDAVNGWAGDYAPNFGILDAVQPVVGSAEGTVFYSDAAGDLALLGPGTAGYLLRTAGAGAPPTWLDPSTLGNSLQTSYDNGATIDTDAGTAVAFSRTASDALNVLELTKNPGSAFGGAALSITMGVNATGAEIQWGANKIQRGSLYLEEKAAALADVAGLVQIWAKNVTPNTLWYTNDIGDDVQLGVGVTAISVVDIDDPSAELNLIQGASHGAFRLCYQSSAAADTWTLYTWDNADSGAENVPHRVDGLTGMWVGVAGRYRSGDSSTDGEMTAFAGTVKEIPVGLTTLYNTSGGAIRADGLAIGAPATNIDIGEGFGHIIDIHTDPDNPTLNRVSWSTQSYAITGLSDLDFTYVYIDSNGNPGQQLTVPTHQQLTERIYLGFMIAFSGVIVNLAFNPYVAANPALQLSGLMDAIGSINQDISISNNGASLEMALSGGLLTARGFGFGSTAAERSDPNTSIIAAAAPASWNTQTQLSAQQGPFTDIDPLNYDLNDVVTLIPGSSNQATNQRIWLFPDGVLGVQYGTVIYSTLANAVSGSVTEAFIDNPLVLQSHGHLLATLSVRKGATDLSDTNDARFLTGSKFGEASIGGAGQSVTSLQLAYNNSLDGTILTDATRTAVKFQRGTALDTDDVFEVLNGAGTQVLGITGEGNIAAEGVLALDSGGASDPTLQASTVDPSAAGGVSAPEGSLLMRFVATAGEVWFKDGAADTAWTQVGTGGGAGNTLDAAYDQGGAGVGRAITADAGAVAITNPNADAANVLELTTTAAATGAALSITNAGDGDAITASADTDQSVVFGRARIDSRVTDFAYFSHYDRDGITEYGMALGPAGSNTINAATSISLANGGSTRFEVTGGFIRGTTSGSGAIHDSASSASNPTVVPNYITGTTGMGGAPGEVAIITGGTQAVRFDASQDQINAGHIQFAQGNRAIFDTDLDTYIRASADDILHMYTGGSPRFTVENALISHNIAVETNVAAIGTAETAGHSLINNTPAAAGAQQYSPMHVQQGAGWKTDATASSQEVKFAQQVETIQGAANPTGDLVFKASIENVSAGAYAEVARLTSGGQLQLQNGSDAAPALTFGDSDTGFRGVASNVYVTVNGFERARWSTSAYQLTFGGSEGGPAIAIGLDNDTGWWRPASDTIAFATGATEAVRWDASQNQINVGSLYITEKASADGDTAGLGQFWVKDTSPNTAYFTDDTGVDHLLGGGVVTLSVADIDDPSIELNVIAGALNGETRLCFETSAGADDWTLYAWDNADSGAENVPYRVDGSSGMWAAIAGKYRSQILVNEGVILGPDGSASSATYSFVSATNLGMYAASSTVIGFTTSGVQRAQISSRGVLTAVSGSGTEPCYTRTSDSDTGAFFVPPNVYAISTGATEAVRWDASQNQTNAGDILPSADGVHDLGTSSVRWALIYGDAAGIRLLETDNGSAASPAVQIGASAYGLFNRTGTEVSITQAGAIAVEWGASKIQTNYGDIVPSADSVHDIGTNTVRWQAIYADTITVGTTPTYTPTNVITDRAFDADSTTLAELADVVGTMIADMQAIGLFS